MADRVLFACDYEDTYNREPGKHPKEPDVNAIRQLRSAGHLVALIFERDGYLAMANIGEYEEEYDFVLASTGGCLIARLPVDPPKYGALVRISTDTANQYFLSELYDLFRSVGARNMYVDVLTFMGGDSEGERFQREYDPAGGLSCWVHYWGGGGLYRNYLVNRNALAFVSPFSQCTGFFKNNITAEGVAMEVNRRYGGWLRAYASGNTAVVVPGKTNKAEGVRRIADFAGIPLDRVWTFGNGDEDACMLSQFNGIATTDGCSQALEAAKYKAASVCEAMEIAVGR